MVRQVWRIRDTYLTDVYLCEEPRDCFWKKSLPFNINHPPAGTQSIHGLVTPQAAVIKWAESCGAKQDCHPLSRVVDSALLEKSGWSGPTGTLLNMTGRCGRLFRAVGQCGQGTRNRGVIHASPNTGSDGVLLLHWSTFAIMSLWLLYVFNFHYCLGWFIYFNLKEWPK